MPLIYRQYGDVVEVTNVEKESSKIRVRVARERKVIYGKRRQDNIFRTRKICMRRLSVGLKEYGRPLLLTCTFEGDSSDAARANDALRLFQMRLRVAIRDCQSIFVPELSPRGRIHFHGLLFGVPMSWGDTRKGGRVVSYGTERTTRYLASLWREGFVDAVATDGSPRLASYLSKYITKEGQHPMFNAMHMVRISQGFPKETVERGVVGEFLASWVKKKKRRLHRWKGYSPYLGSISKDFYDLSF